MNFTMNWIFTEIENGLVKIKDSSERIKYLYNKRNEYDDVFWGRDRYENILRKIDTIIEREKSIHQLASTPIINFPDHISESEDNSSIEYATQNTFHKKQDKELQVFYTFNLFDEIDLIDFKKCLCSIALPKIKINFSMGTIQDFGYFISEFEKFIDKNKIKSYNTWISERFTFKGSTLNEKLVSSYKSRPKERTLSLKGTIDSALKILNTQEIHPKTKHNTSL